jgi:hypothetical protein
MRKITEGRALNETPPNESCRCRPTTSPETTTSCCCQQSAAPSTGSTALGAAWVLDTVSTPVGPIPRIATTLRMADKLGTCKMRFGIGRSSYRIPPGLYAVGNPAPESPVLVSANYKMTFDRLRSELADLPAWILILDTQGVNVWCAAGKGTFGTDELVRRIETTNLPDIVSHNTLVLPQLGAPGVAAHEVRKRSGFRVVYGPVRANDIPAFLAAKMKATPAMRQVQFNILNRIATIPVELFHWAKHASIIAVCFLVLAGLSRAGFRWADVVQKGTIAAGLILTTFIGSCLLAPVCLPWLPGKAFAVKGFALGVIMAVVAGAISAGVSDGAENWAELAAWALIIPAVASFVTMNYTGTSTYTSLSGVRREMRVAVPVQLAAAIVGLSLWIIGRFV